LGHLLRAGSVMEESIREVDERTLPAAHDAFEGADFTR
jgi:hypothetical protein